MEKRTLQQHIDNNIEELERGDLSPQRRRHLEYELYELNKYKENHLDETRDPTPLELYCNLNPDSPECKIYDN